MVKFNRFTLIMACGLLFTKIILHVWRCSTFFMMLVRATKTLNKLASLTCLSTDVWRLGKTFQTTTSSAACGWRKQRAFTSNAISINHYKYHPRHRPISKPPLAGKRPYAKSLAFSEKSLRCSSAMWLLRSLSSVTWPQPYDVWLKLRPLVL